MIRLAGMLLLAVFLAYSSVFTAAAVQPDEQLADPALEQRARSISAELRCLVCQNQSIDDSDAPLARDLRILVRQRIEGGDSDSEVRDYLVARYGHFILLKPPLEVRTVLLWATPILVLLAGAAALAMRSRRASEQGGEKLSAEEEEQLARILREQS